MIRIRYATLGLLTLHFAFVAFSLRLYTRPIDDKSLDIHGLFYLAALAAMGVFVLFTASRVNWRMLAVNPFLPLLLLYAMFSAIGAPSPAFALFVVSTWIMVLVFFAALFAFVDIQSVFRSITIMSALLVAISIVVYFVSPSHGRFFDWIEGELGPTRRIVGILGHPQFVGFLTAVSLYATWRFRRDWEFRKTTQLALVAIFATGLFLAYSRTSVIVLVVLVVTTLIARRPIFIIPLIASASVLALLGVATDLSLEMLSRSGDASEITTLTGRSEIWPVVIELWWQRPIFGWGTTSMQSLLPNDPRLFEAAAHAHNLFLEILVTQGLLGFTIFMLSLLFAFQLALRVQSDVAIALASCTLVFGITEAAPFASRAGLNFMLFAILYLAPLLPLHLRNSNSVDVDAAHQRNSRRPRPADFQARSSGSRALSSGAKGFSG